MAKKILFIVIASAAVAAVVGYNAVWAPLEFPSPKTVVIGKGKSFAAAAEVLRDSGIIPSAFLFRTAGKLFGYRNVRAGRYLIESGGSALDLLRDLQTGRSAVSFFVTIPEGLRGVQIARVLRRDVGIDTAKFLRLFGDPARFGLSVRTGSLEGFLFPDTYDFAWQEDEEVIIERMVSEYRKFFVDSLVHRARALKLSTTEVMTMASIVEGEAVRSDERVVIAGLYYNRLKIRMRLEADPTVQYGIRDGPRRLTYKDLKTPSPYNTYMIRGLPPGPINNPGRASILAALYPARHNYLFFVADGSGGHVFARTYSEHMKNVRAYRRQRAN